MKPPPSVTSTSRLASGEKLWARTACAVLSHLKQHRVLLAHSLDMLHLPAAAVAHSAKLSRQGALACVGIGVLQVLLDPGEYCELSA